MSKMVTGIMLDIRLLESSTGDGTIRVRTGQHAYRDFYDSVVVAKKTAERLTGKRFSRDIIIEQVNNDFVSGGSGAMLFCLRFISMLTGIRLDPEVTGTGGLCHCEVLEVNNVEEKVLVAKEAGFAVFLFPAANTAPNIEAIDCRAVRDIREAWQRATK